MDTVCSNGHPLDRSHSFLNQSSQPSPPEEMPYGVSTSLLSLRYTVLFNFSPPCLVSPFLVHSPSGLYLLSSPGFSISMPLSRLCSFLFPFTCLNTQMYTHTHTAQLALLPPIFSGPDLFHERERCQWARHLSFYLPPSSPCAHVRLWFLFLFNSFQSYSIIVEKWSMGAAESCANSLKDILGVLNHRKNGVSQPSIASNYTSQYLSRANIDSVHRKWVGALCSEP